MFLPMKSMAFRFFEKLPGDAFWTHGAAPIPILLQWRRSLPWMLKGSRWPHWTYDGHGRSFYVEDLDIERPPGWRVLYSNLGTHIDTRKPTSKDANLFSQFCEKPADGIAMIHRHIYWYLYYVWMYSYSWRQKILKWSESYLTVYHH